MAETSVFGQKRIPSDSFHAYLFSAFVVDGITFFFPFIPGLGTAFIAFCRGMYMLNGYKTDRMNAQTAIDAAIEFVPFLEALPGATAFVIGTYMVNVAETKPANDNAQQAAKKSLLRRAVSLGTSLIPATRAIGIAGKALGAEKAVAGAARGGAVGKNIGYEEKETAGKSMSNAPVSATDKNTGYKNTDNQKPQEPKNRTDNVGYGQKSLDGIARRDDVAGRTTGYQPTQPLFRKAPKEEEEDQDVEYQEAA